MELQIFENPMFGEIRTIEENGAVLFCGSDVAKALGYGNPPDALKRHCRSIVKRDTPHPQSLDKTIEMAFIPEGDIYRLAAKSELPGADAFEHWIFDEVLPSIRKHGAYMTPATIEQMIATPEFGIKLLSALQEEQEKRRQLEFDNAYKGEVITGLTAGISLDQKRQILNKVMRKGFGSADQQRDRWGALYQHFEMIHHCNVDQRIANWEERMCKPWKKSKLDFVDKQMGMLPELYAVAVKLFETDVEAVKRQLFVA